MSFNLYQGAGLSELVDAADELSGELESKRSRTADEQREVVLKTRDLLRAMARMIEPSPTGADAPEGLAAQKPITVTQAFGAWHERHNRHHRAMTLIRAANWVLGDRAEDWWNNPGLPTEAKPFVMAIESEEGLRQQLAALDELRRIIRDRTADRDNT